MCLCRERNSHTKSNLLNSPSQCGHQKALFKINILYQLSCSHMSANYITIREKDRHGIIYVLSCYKLSY